MRDRDIREALLDQLNQEHLGDQATLILDELGVCEGEARVDVAVVNGSLAGFEIKSDRDTLARLPRQVEAYDRVFDFMTIIVGERFAEKISTVVPAHWGISVAADRSGQVELVDVRPAEENPAAQAFSVAQLLWRDEALDLLARYSLDAGMRSKPRRALWSALADNLPLADLRDAVRDQMRLRAGWRPDPPPWSDGD